MQKNYLFSLLLMTVTTCAFGQLPKAGYRTHHYVDLALEGGPQQYGAALSWYKLHGVAFRKRIKVGYGIRFTSYAGKDQAYVTAPARLTSGTTGPFVIFTENILANFDTLRISRPQVNYLNATLNLQFDPFPKWGAGFNIDVVGFSFGGVRTGQYEAHSVGDSFEPEQAARPTPFNLLLTSDNDRGSLNSEFYLAYRPKPNLVVRGGYSYSFTEYTTRRQLALGNDRFRNKIGMVTLAVSYNPFLKK